MVLSVQHRVNREIGESILRGAWEAVGGGWPLSFAVRLCALRPAFIPKGKWGRGFRAVARNGRILLACHAPVDRLAGEVAEARLQTWHRAVGPSVRGACGILMCVRAGPAGYPGTHFIGCLSRGLDERREAGLELGGGRFLVLRGPPSSLESPPESELPELI